MEDRNKTWTDSYVTPAIGDYLENLFARQDPGMLDAARAIEESGLPQIQVSPNDGRILEVLLRLADTRKVVELGTLGAYSSQWIARAIGDGV